MSWFNLFFGFKGRISRRQYWLASIVPTIFAWPLTWNTLTLARAVRKPSHPGIDIGPIVFYDAKLTTISTLIAFCLYSALNTKRLHDFGRSGYLQFFPLVAMLVATLALGVILGRPPLILAFLVGVLSLACVAYSCWTVGRIWFSRGSNGRTSHDED